MLKNKISLPMIALVLGLLVTFTQSAFKPVNAKKVSLHQYQYNNNDDTNIDQTSSWTDVTGTTPSSCPSGSALPCVIELDLDNTSLSSFLTSNPDAADIIASPAKRSTKRSL